MRIIAVIDAKGWQKGEQGAIKEIRTAFSRHSLIETDDPTEKRDIISALIADMSEADLRRFQRTVRFVARHALDGTVAAVSVLDDAESQLLIRLRNPLLRQLVPNGHNLLSDLLTQFDTDSPRTLTLAHCEIRERQGGQNEGFLFGEWRGGDVGFFRFIYGQRTPYFIGVTLLFLLGLGLEVVLSLMNLQTPVAELGLRLGAPLLVSSLVLMLERLSLWIDQRTPALKWTPIRRLEVASPLHGSFEASAR